MCLCVFCCSQLVAKKQGPRLVPGASPAKLSTSIQTYVTQWVALLGQFRDLGRLTTKGFDIVGNMMSSTQEVAAEVTLTKVQDAVLCKELENGLESSFSR